MDFSNTVSLSSLATPSTFDSTARLLPQSSDKVVSNGSSFNDMVAHDTGLAEQNQTVNTATSGTKPRFLSETVNYPGSNAKFKTDSTTSSSELTFSTSSIAAEKSNPTPSLLRPNLTDSTSIDLKPNNTYQNPNYTVASLPPKISQFNTGVNDDNSSSSHEYLTPIANTTGFSFPDEIFPPFLSPETTTSDSTLSNQPFDFSTGVLPSFLNSPSVTSDPTKTQVPTSSTWISLTSIPNANNTVAAPFAISGNKTVPVGTNIASMLSSATNSGSQLNSSDQGYPISHANYTAPAMSVFGANHTVSILSIPHANNTASAFLTHADNNATILTHRHIESALSSYYNSSEFRANHTLPIASNIHTKSIISPTPSSFKNSTASIASAVRPNNLTYVTSIPSVKSSSIGFNRGVNNTVITTYIPPDLNNTAPVSVERNEAAPKYNRFNTTELPYYSSSNVQTSVPKLSINSNIAPNNRTEISTVNPIGKNTTAAPVASPSISVINVSPLPYNTTIGIIPSPTHYNNTDIAHTSDIAAEFNPKPLYSNHTSPTVRKRPSSLKGISSISSNKTASNIPTNGTASLTPFSTVLPLNQTRIALNDSGYDSAANTFLSTFIQNTGNVPQPSFTSYIPYPFKLNNTASHKPTFNNRTIYPMNFTVAAYNGTIKQSSTSIPVSSHYLNSTTMTLLNANNTATTSVAVPNKLNNTQPYLIAPAPITARPINQTAPITVTVPHYNHTAPFGNKTEPSTTVSICPHYWCHHNQTALFGNNTEPTTTVSICPHSWCHHNQTGPFINNTASISSTVPNRNMTVPKTLTALYSTTSAIFGNMTAINKTPNIHVNQTAPFSNKTAPVTAKYPSKNVTAPEIITIPYSRPTPPFINSTMITKNPVSQANRTASVDNSQTQNVVSICPYHCSHNQTAPFINNTAPYGNKTIGVMTKTSALTVYHSTGPVTLTSHFVLPCSTEPQCSHFVSHNAHNINPVTVTIPKGNDYTTVTVPPSMPFPNGTTVTVPYSKYKQLKAGKKYTTVTLKLSHTTQTLTSEAYANNKTAIVPSSMQKPNATIITIPYSCGNSTILTSSSVVSESVTSPNANGTIITVPYSHTKSKLSSVLASAVISSVSKSNAMNNTAFTNSLTEIPVTRSTYITVPLPTNPSKTSYGILTTTSIYTLSHTAGPVTVTTHKVIPCSTEEHCHHMNTHFVTVHKTVSGKEGETVYVTVPGSVPHKYSTTTVVIPHKTINSGATTAIGTQIVTVTIPYSTRKPVSPTSVTPATVSYTFYVVTKTVDVPNGESVVYTDYSTSSCTTTSEIESDRPTVTIIESVMPHHTVTATVWPSTQPVDLITKIVTNFEESSDSNQNVYLSTQTFSKSTEHVITLSIPPSSKAKGQEGQLVTLTVPYVPISTGSSDSLQTVTVYDDGNGHYITVDPWAPTSIVTLTRSHSSTKSKASALFMPSGDHMSPWKNNTISTVSSKPGNSNSYPIKNSTQPTIITVPYQNSTVKTHFNNTVSQPHYINQTIATRFNNTLPSVSIIHTESRSNINNTISSIQTSPVSSFAATHSLNNTAPLNVNKTISYKSEGTQMVSASQSRWNNTAPEITITQPYEVKTSQAQPLSTSVKPFPALNNTASATHDVVTICYTDVCHHHKNTATSDLVVHICHGTICEGHTILETVSASHTHPSFNTTAASISTVTSSYNPGVVTVCSETVCHSLTVPTSSLQSSLPSIPAVTICHIDTCHTHTSNVGSTAISTSSQVPTVIPVVTICHHEACHGYSMTPSGSQSTVAPSKPIPTVTICGHDVCSTHTMTSVATPSYYPAQTSASGYEVVTICESGSCLTQVIPAITKYISVSQTSTFTTVIPTVTICQQDICHTHTVTPATSGQSLLGHADINSFTPPFRTGSQSTSSLTVSTKPRQSGPATVTVPYQPSNTGPITVTIPYHSDNTKPVTITVPYKPGKTTPIVIAPAPTTIILTNQQASIFSTVSTPVPVTISVPHNPTKSGPVTITVPHDKNNTAPIVIVSSPVSTSQVPNTASASPTSTSLETITICYHEGCHNLPMPPAVSKTNGTKQNVPTVTICGENVCHTHTMVSKTTTEKTSYSTSIKSGQETVTICASEICRTQIISSPSAQTITVPHSGSAKPTVTTDIVPTITICQHDFCHTQTVGKPTSVTVASNSITSHSTTKGHWTEWISVGVTTIYATPYSFSSTVTNKPVPTPIETIDPVTNTEIKTTGNNINSNAVHTSSAYIVTDSGTTVTVYGSVNVNSGTTTIIFGSTVPGVIKTTSASVTSPTDNSVVTVTLSHSDSRVPTGASSFNPTLTSKPTTRLDSQSIISTASQASTYTITEQNSSRVSSVSQPASLSVVTICNEKTCTGYPMSPSSPSLSQSSIIHSTSHPIPTITICATNTCNTIIMTSSTEDRTISSTVTATSQITSSTASDYEVITICEHQVCQTQSISLPVVTITRTIVVSTLTESTRSQTSTTESTNASASTISITQTVPTLIPVTICQHDTCHTHTVTPNIAPTAVNTNSSNQNSKSEQSIVTAYSTISESNSNVPLTITITDYNTDFGSHVESTITVTDYGSYSDSPTPITITVTAPNLNSGSSSISVISITVSEFQNSVASETIFSSSVSNSGQLPTSMIESTVTVTASGPNVSPQTGSLITKAITESSSEPKATSSSGIVTLTINNTYSLTTSAPHSVSSEKDTTKSISQSQIKTYTITNRIPTSTYTVTGLYTGSRSHKSTVTVYCINDVCDTTIPAEYRTRAVPTDLIVTPASRIPPHTVYVECSSSGACVTYSEIPSGYEISPIASKTSLYTVSETDSSSSSSLTTLEKSSTVKISNTDTSSTLTFTKSAITYTEVNHSVSISETHGSTSNTKSLASYTYSTSESKPNDLTSFQSLPTTSSLATVTISCTSTTCQTTIPTQYSALPTESRPPMATVFIRCSPEACAYYTILPRQPATSTSSSHSISAFNSKPASTLTIKCLFNGACASIEPNAMFISDPLTPPPVATVSIFCDAQDQCFSTTFRPGAESFATTTSSASLATASASTVDIPAGSTFAIPKPAVSSTVSFPSAVTLTSAFATPVNTNTFTPTYTLISTVFVSTETVSFSKSKPVSSVASTIVVKCSETVCETYVPTPNASIPNDSSDNLATISIQCTSGVCTTKTVLPTDIPASASQAEISSFATTPILTIISSTATMYCDSTRCQFGLPAEFSTLPPNVQPPLAATISVHCDDNKHKCVTQTLSPETDADNAATPAVAAFIDLSIASSSVTVLNSQIEPIVTKETSFAVSRQLDSKLASIDVLDLIAGQSSDVAPAKSVAPVLSDNYYGSVDNTKPTAASIEQDSKDGPKLFESVKNNIEYYSKASQAIEVQPGQQTGTVTVSCSDNECSTHTPEKYPVQVSNSSNLSSDTITVRCAEGKCLTETATPANMETYENKYDKSQTTAPALVEPSSSTSSCDGQGCTTQSQPMILRGGASSINTPIKLMFSATLVSTVLCIIC